MKKNVLIKSILTMAIGTVITTSALIPCGGPRPGENPDPEMAVIEYNINI